MDDDDNPSKRAWSWVVETLSSLKEITISTLQGLIDAAPVRPDDLSENTREFVALKCLEELATNADKADSDPSYKLDSRIGLDFSRSCEDVLQEISGEVPLLKVSRAELLKRDVYSFIKHKRAARASVKCYLEQLKESILEGTHPHTDYLKERSGLFHRNSSYTVHVNDGKCDDHSENDDRNSTDAENVGEKNNSTSLILEDRNKSSKDHLLANKRNKVHSTDGHLMGHLAEKRVYINESGDFLRNSKRTKCYASASFESEKQKPVSEFGREVSETSTERILLISEEAGNDTEKNLRVTLGDESLEKSQNRCTASTLHQSSSHNEVFHEELNIPFDASLMDQHKFGGEKSQQKQVESIPTNITTVPPVAESCHDMTTTFFPLSTSGVGCCENTIMPETTTDTVHQVEPISTNDNSGNVKHVIEESQPNQREQNAASLNISHQPVACDKAAVDAVHDCRAELSSDSDGYHHEKNDLAAKKHEFMNSPCTIGPDFSAMNELTKLNLCMKCTEGGKLLACKTTTCPLMVHKKCLGASAQLDEKGNFFCPYCVYSRTISEYLEAKKKAFMARKELAVFMSKGIVATELVPKVHKQDQSRTKKSNNNLEHVCVQNYGGDQLAGWEDS